MEKTAAAVLHRRTCVSSPGDIFSAQIVTTALLEAEPVPQQLGGASLHWSIRLQRLSPLRSKLTELLLPHGRVSVHSELAGGEGLPAG